MNHSSQCPECGSSALYTNRTTIQGPLGPNLLPDTGSLSASVDAVVCGECGLLRWFVPELLRARIARSPQWTKLGAE